MKTSRLSTIVMSAVSALAIGAGNAPAAAPLVHYKFDELVPGSTVVNSGTAANADAALQGWANIYVSNTPNKYSPNAVNFYVSLWGSAEMIADSSELDYLGALTVTFWLNLRNHPAQYNLPAHSGGRFSEGGFYVSVGAAPLASAFTLDFYVIGATNWVPSAAGSSPGTFDADGKWTFVALTYGSNTMRFFAGSDAPAAPLTQVGGDVTGVDYQGNPSHTGVSPSHKLAIGNHSGVHAGAGHNMPAWMDDFRVYGEVLSASALEQVRLSNISTPVTGTIITIR